MRGTKKLENNPTWLPVVALALCDGAGRVLMHKRPAHKHHGGLWEYPGGKVEPGETPAKAMVREAKEELGIDLDASYLRPAAFAQEQDSKGRTPIVILLYTSTRWSGQPQALEGGQVGWFAPHGIDQLDTPPLDRQLSASLFGRGTL